MLSEDEVRKLLNLEDIKPGEHIKVDSTMQKKQMIDFLNNGGSNTNVLTINSTNEDIVSYIKSIHIDKLNLPCESDSDFSCMTREKYMKISEIIVSRIKQKQPIDLNEIQKELGYKHLKGAIQLD